MEFTLDQFDTIHAKLDTVIAEAGEMRTEQALACHRLGQIEHHMERLNGRTMKCEERLAGFDNREAERRGAWKLIVVIASIPASIIGAVAAWIAGHK